MSHHRFHTTRFNLVGGTLLLGATIALAPALRTAESTATNNTVSLSSHTHDVVAHHVPDAHQALTEIHAYAATHLDEFEVLPETLTLDEAWSSDWHLHSVAVVHHGSTVYLYHATHKQHPEVRYVAMWLAGGATDWEPAH
ncbi:MAG TPA: hypothetical protein VHW00_11840 [Thermoanaerobaculia bacterium]|nr:hypothetical protein [Thermoanaerobaculia bacterium]